MAGAAKDAMDHVARELDQLEAQVRAMREKEGGLAGMEERLRAEFQLQRTAAQKSTAGGVEKVAALQEGLTQLRDGLAKTQQNRP
mmetsp:Transcript_19187/g.45596  ORF Transcript_19187/g.45596 Transcript_19187/m.45596 type:complete len:85 (-) Transcript_19187:157-411(-)